MPELPKGITIDAARRFVAARLEEAGITSSHTDARLLTCAATGLDAVRLVANGNRILKHVECAHLATLLSRRLAREPVWRILSKREFYGREFLLSPATLEPRPDSETLIEAALELATTFNWHDKPIRIIDIGTGTGALIITLLCELPHALGSATDISAEALDTAQANAQRHGVSARLRLGRASSLDGISETFDLLISNPPYIPTSEIDGLDPEVRVHDPHAALDGGPDGLRVYREIAARLDTVIPNGTCLFEVGATQADAVAAIVEAAFTRRQPAADRRWQDLQGHTRCVAHSAHSTCNS